MSVISEQIRELKAYIAAYKEPPYGRAVVGTAKVLQDAVDTIETLSAKVHANNMHSGWHPIDERVPGDDRFILLSFANFSVPMIGRYHDDAFYLGDCDEEDTCSANNLFVNAWMELPEAYKEDE